jgi:hypothetical protein
VAFPLRIESTVDTRIVGRAELAIRYTNFSKLEAAEDDDAAAASDASPAGIGQN